MSKEKVYVYIGRFQTAHVGHAATIKHAMQNADRVVILVGSSDIARDPKNPFTFSEREKVLESICLREASELWNEGKRVKFNILPVHDSIYNNNKWLKEVQKQVQSVTLSTDITLTGCKKNNDESTFYLDCFPQWKQDFVQEESVQVDGKSVELCSTSIRTEYFEQGNVNASYICPEAKEFLEKFKVSNAQEYNLLKEEHTFIVQYKADMHKKLPYLSIPFLTGDTLIVCAAHILLIKRRTVPGKGLFALPGGFFDKDKDLTQVDTAIRELIEETKIKVPEKVLRGNIRSVDEFGDFNRSLRWRIITKCVYIQLPDIELPEVEGSDDAEQAFWYPLSEVEQNQSMFFEDHYSIISHLLSL